MTLWRWLNARSSAMRAIAACAAAGLIKSLAMPLATWAIYARPEGLVFLALAGLYAGLLFAAWWAEVRSADAVHARLGGEVHRLRLSIVARVRTAELRFVEQNRRALDDAMRDTQDLASAMGALQGYVRAAFELGGYVLYALFATGPAALALIAGLGWLGRVMRRRARVERAALADLGGRERALGRAIDDLWTGMPRFMLDPAAMADVQAEVGIRRGALTDLLRVHSRARVDSTTINTMYPLILCGLLALLAVGPFGLSGNAALSFVAIVFLTRGPTFALLNVGDLVLAERALERLEAFERALDAAQIGAPATTPPPPGPLMLDAVGYRFEGGFELGPISLTVAPGELVFVVGHNGSGKTTLMKVASGLYPTHGGAIRLGERRPTRDQLRAAFTVTFIDAYLFDRAYGLGASDADIEAALDEVGLGDVLGVRHGRFETLELSTGQRRRLALAVALLERRPLLIFDEWDAHQDPETKRWYFETLLPRLAREGRAVIAVCHDDRFFDCADRVIELRDGQLVAAPAG